MEQIGETMKAEKKPMDDIKKAKLMYSGELAFFAIVFLVLGILELTFVLNLRDIIITIFQYVGLVGGAYFIFDLIWTIKSEKKRKRNSMFDKISMLPGSLYSLTICILMIANVISEKTTKQILIGILLLYFALVYLAQAVYHWFHIHPTMLEAIEEDRKEAAKKKAETEKVNLGEKKEEAKPENKDDKVVEVTPIQKEDKSSK